MIKNHKADSFDGGRAASIIPERELPPENATELKPSSLLNAQATSDDDDARALALAIMALTSDND
jgi:hypothetical protein